MPRSYRHIQQYEKEIMKLKEQGKSNREICKKFGLELKQLKISLTATIENNANLRQE